jgi:hypothetical protein
MTKDSPPDRCFTVREVAELPDVTPRTISRMTRERAVLGALRVLGNWRFLTQQRDRWTKTTGTGPWV